MNIIDLLFPIKCIACGSSSRYICNSCIGEVSKSKQLCIVCEKPSIDGTTHIRCKTPLGLDGAVSIWNYEKIIREAIIKLKYKFSSEIAKEFAFYISKFLKSNINALPKHAVLTPVPLHWLRKNWRGFNQSFEVGKLLACSMDWDFVDDCVIRKIKTKPQTELKGKKRIANVRGVFAINPDYFIPATNYLIFDDVWTTGTTLKEVGKVLKRNGAKKVWALTIAK